MRFKFEDKEFVLEFHREHRIVEVFRNRKKINQRSLHPYTVASVYEINEGAAGPTQRIIASASVGCAANIDVYRVSEGRFRALDALSVKLRKQYRYSKEFNAAMWQAYRNRGQQPTTETVEGEVVPQQQEQADGLA